MKPKCTVFGFGVFCLVVVLSRASAEPEAPKTEVVEPTDTVGETAVPRPVPRWEAIPASPGNGSRGAFQEDSLPGSGIPEAGESGESPGTPSPLPPEPWELRPVTILGIDRTEFPEIMVVFSLRDELGNPVTDIVPDFLEITEDEAPQEFYGLAPCVPEDLPGEPLSLMLLIDSSGSMQRYIDVVQNAAARFVGRFKEGDQAGVVGFCDRPVVLQPLTDNKKKIEKGVYSVQPRGFTALYDSLCLAVSMLKPCSGRRAIILVTDGKDDDGTGAQLSRRSLDSVIRSARKAKVPIFAIGLGQDISQNTLSRIGDETGGDFLFAPTGEDVDELYEEVARTLGRGDEGFYKLHFRTTQDEKDSTTRTVIVRYKNDSAVARYPAPRNLFWPLSKVIQ